MAGNRRSVLVTGGAGYIGSHAAKALSRSGYHVVVFDSLVAGHRQAARFGDFIEGDTGDSAAVSAALKRYECFAVMHFAAFLDVGESVREVIDAVGRAVGRKVPWTLATRRPGDPAVLYAAPQKAEAELHWKPKFADLDSIVRTAWDWHRTHPHGYGGQ